MRYHLIRSGYLSRFDYSVETPTWFGVSGVNSIRRKESGLNNLIDKVEICEAVSFS